MRALVQHQFGDPAEVLAVEEVELPEPGPGQVRLKVVLSPIHNHDLWEASGSLRSLEAGTEYKKHLAFALEVGGDHTVCMRCMRM